MKYFQGASVFGAPSDTTIEFLLKNGRVLELNKGDLVNSRGDKATNSTSYCKAPSLYTSSIWANSRSSAITPLEKKWDLWR